MGRVRYLRHGRRKMHGWFGGKDKLKEIYFQKLGVRFFFFFLENQCDLS